MSHTNGPGQCTRPIPIKPISIQRILKSYRYQIVCNGAACPMVYGKDVCHGHNNIVYVAIIFHALGSGMTCVTCDLVQILCLEIAMIYWIDVINNTSYPIKFCLIGCKYAFVILAWLFSVLRCSLEQDWWSFIALVFGYTLDFYILVMPLSVWNSMTHFSTSFFYV